jgi:hypothetical protein
LIREKADNRNIYLISSNPDEPEMYELQCQNPREKRIWIDTIGAAVAWRNVFLAEIKASSSETFLFSAPFGSGPATLAKFQYNQRLEELRNLLNRLSKEKSNGPCRRSTSASSANSCSNFRNSSGLRTWIFSN